MSEETIDVSNHEFNTETQQMQNLRNQIEINKKLAKALDENPGVISSSLTHLMLGGIIQGLQVIEVKINQLSAQIAKQDQPKIFVP